MELASFERFRAAWQPMLLGRLDAHIARMHWSADQLAAHQRERLRALVAHAIERSPFHRRRLAGVDPRALEVADLAQLPVMTKPDMMDHLDDVFTDRRLSVAAVERALAATDEQPVPIADDFIAMASGGSSGRRGVFVFDREALAEFIASLLRGLTARLRALAAGMPGGTLPCVSVAMVAARSAVHATGTADSLTVGQAFPFRFIAVPVTLALDDIVARLNALNAPLIYGYPSMLARLGAERRAGRLRITPRMVVSISETLTPELRAAIRRGFEEPVIDAFGSTEALVGATQPDDTVHTFNSDGCIIELVDADNRPVAEGVPSAKVLVTNLANHVQPLIRYELADSLSRQPPAAEHGHLRATVQGRADEELRYGGVVIHPHAIRSVMVKAPAVLDYQIRQIARGVELVAMASGPVELEPLRRDVATALAAAGLPDPTVDVRITDALERDARTGKVRRVVPLA